MKEDILLFTLLSALAVLEACGSSTSSDSDVTERKLSVNTMSELPGCTESKEGFVAYVVEDKDTVVCISQVWRIVGVNAGVESSSDDAGESSSSASKESSSSLTPAGDSSASHSSSSNAKDPVNSSSSVENDLYDSTNVSVVKLSMTDPRDNRVYKVVPVGKQIWMAENMNYDGAEIVGASTYLGWCYTNEDGNCDKYGRLYNWKTAKNICPEGWRLPSLEDWKTMISAVGDSLTAGRFLKSTESWLKVTNDSTASVNGLDSYEFAALPAGFRKEDYNDGRYYDLGKFANFWTFSASGESYAYHVTMRYDSGKVSTIAVPVDYALSVRCVKN